MHQGWSLTRELTVIKNTHSIIQISETLKFSNHLIMCSSRKNPYPPHGRSLEILRGRGRGVLKAIFLESMYENKLEFPRRMGVQNKKPSVGEYGYFLELHNGTKHCFHVIYPPPPPTISQTPKFISFGGLKHHNSMV